MWHWPAAIRRRAHPAWAHFRRHAIKTKDLARQARVLGTSYVSPRLSVINLRLDGRMFARHMLIVSDNADAECFRRLRVLLRWGYRKAP